MKLKSKAILLGAMLSTSLPILAYQGIVENQQIASTKQALQKREPAGLREAAEAGLKKFVTELSQDEDPDSLPSNFPFNVSSVSQLKNAKLDFAFEVFSADTNNIKNSALPFDRMLTSTGTWKVVVTVNNQAVGLIDLAKVNGKWEVRSAGAAKIAEKVSTIAKSHAKGEAFRFVRIHSTTNDFIETISSAGDLKYVPLNSDISLTGLSKSALNEKEETREKNSAEVLSQLKASLARTSK